MEKRQTTAGIPHGGKTRGGWSEIQDAKLKRKNGSSLGSLVFPEQRKTDPWYSGCVVIQVFGSLIMMLRVTWQQMPEGCDTIPYYGRARTRFSITVKHFRAAVNCLTDVNAKTALIHSSMVFTVAVIDDNIYTPIKHCSKFCFILIHVSCYILEGIPFPEIIIIIIIRQ